MSLKLCVSFKKVLRKQSVANKPINTLTAFAGTHTRGAAAPLCPTCMRPLLESYASGVVMERMPLSKEPLSQYLLSKMATSDTFSLAISSAMLGSALSTIRPESLLWGIAGLFSLYLFISDYIGESEVTILIKNISSFKTYSILTYISVALSGFLLTFDATLLFTFVVIFPVIINAFMVRPFVFVNLYKKNYTRLFGVIDA